MTSDTNDTLSDPTAEVLATLTFFYGWHCWGTVIFFEMLMVMIICELNPSAALSVFMLAGPILLPLFSLLILQGAYQRYAITFSHRTFTTARLQCSGLFLSFLFLCTCFLFATAFAQSRFIVAVWLLLATLLIAVCSLWFTIGRIITSFSAIYRVTGSIPFIRWDVYNGAASALGRFEILLFSVVLIGCVLAGSYYRMTADMTGFAAAFGGILWLVYSLCFYALFVPALYQLFWLQPKIESVFQHPLLSDCAGIFEKNRTVRDAVLGPGASLLPMEFEIIAPS